MASSITNTGLRLRPTTCTQPCFRKKYGRLQSSATNARLTHPPKATGGPDLDIVKPATFPLARLSTSSMLRTLLLSTFFTTPVLFRPGFAVFNKIANSTSIWLSPDRNPLLRAIAFPLVYRQFCAGRNPVEIRQQMADSRRLGFRRSAVLRQRSPDCGGSDSTERG